MFEIEHFHEIGRLHPDPMLLLSSTGQIVAANPSSLSALDLPADEVVGKTLYDIVDTPADQLKEYLQLCLRNRQLILGSFSRLQQGEWTKYTVKAGLLRVASEHQQAIVLCLFKPKDVGIKNFTILNQKIENLTKEIARRKRIERELTAAKLQAEEASQAKSDFLALMSHEIRSPLTSILGFAELMYHQEPSDQLECLETIKRNGRQLVSLIDGILDLSKVEAGKLAFNRERFLLDDFLNEVKLSFLPQAHKNNLRLSLSTEGKIPLSIISDRMRLQQILVNLISNAIKFTKEGGIAIRVRCRSTSQFGVELAFIITDTGCGIDPKKKSKLFLPFSQVDSSTSREYGGTGLGLMLSKRFAHALGGDVILSESTFGKGSTFVVTIDPGPREQLDFVGEGGPKPQYSTAQSAFNLDASQEKSLHGIRVLLVEDLPDNRRLISKIMEMLGAEIDMAVDGIEGVDKALAKPYDLILMDLRLPRLDGYQATLKLRQEGFEKPIIAITAHAMDEEKERCIAIGCDGFLTKPIDKEKLLAMVKQLTRSKLA